MDNQRFEKIGRTTDELTCAVDEAQDLVQCLLSGRVSAEQRKDIAGQLRSALGDITDAADTIYSVCEADYADGEYDTEFLDSWSEVLRRLPQPRNVRTDELAGRIQSFNRIN